MSRAAVNPASPDLGDSWGLRGGGPVSAQHVGEQLRGRAPQIPSSGYSGQGVSRVHLARVGEPPGLSPPSPALPLPFVASAHKLAPQPAPGARAASSYL